MSRTDELTRPPGYSVALLDAELAREAFDAALRSHDVEDATRAAAVLWEAMKRLRDAS